MRRTKVLGFRKQMQNNSCYTVNEKEAALVLFIFETYLQSESVEETVRKLNMRHTASENGSLYPSTDSAKFDADG